MDGISHHLYIHARWAPRIVIHGVTWGPKINGLHWGEISVWAHLVCIFKKARKILPKTIGWCPPKKSPKSGSRKMASSKCHHVRVHVRRLQICPPKHLRKLSATDGTKLDLNIGFQGSGLIQCQIYNPLLVSFG